MVLSLKRILGIGALGLMLMGTDDCNNNRNSEPVVELQKEKTSTSTESQYTVKRVAIFGDDLAYGEQRGIYEITDQKTGKVYLGISGIGITEVGSHKSGDNYVEDER